MKTCLSIIFMAAVSGSFLAQDILPPESDQRQDYGVGALQVTVVDEAVSAVGDRLLRITGELRSTPLAWPREAPLRLTVADEAGVSRAVRSLLVPLVGGQQPINLELALAPGTYVIDLLLDPNGVVNEPHEDDNTASVTVTVEPAEVYDGDLSLADADSSVRPVTVTASVNDPELPQLIDSTVRRLAGSADGFIGSSVWPYFNGFTTDHLYDLVAVVNFSYDTETVDELAEILLSELGDAWYTADVVRVPTDLTAIAASDWLAFAPVVLARQIVLGITLAATEQAVSYWRAETTVHWRHQEIRPSLFAPVIPVAVAYSGVMGDVAVTQTDIVHLPGFGEARSVAYLPGGGEAIEVEMMVDPEDRFHERSEDNNAASAAWRPPPPLAVDLLPICDEVSIRRVSCSAGADNPVLLELVKRTALQALGDLECRAIRVYPLNTRLAAIDKIIDTTLGDFDLALVAQLPADAAIDVVGERLLTALAAEWYVARAFSISLLPIWQSSLPDVASTQLVAIGLALTATDEVRSYYRVGVPVRYDVNDAPALPLRVPVTIRLASANSDDALTAERRDCLLIRPGHTATAVGFFPVRSEQIEVGAAVDPDDRLAEVDETNNSCQGLGGQSEPHPRAEFVATVEIIPAGDDNTGAAQSMLIVHGALLNPGDTALELNFNSSLQMDFTAGDYQWSAGMLFLDVLTAVVVPPGGSHEWAISVPLSDVAGDTGRLPELTVFLVGTEYAVHLAAPGTDPADDVGEPHDDNLNSSGGPPVADHIDDVVVTGSGAAFSLLIRNQLGTTLTTRLIQGPAQGVLTNDGDVWHFEAPEDFAGIDYLLLEVTDGEQTTTVMRRLKSGLQEQILHLVAGWNLVSFPTVPVESVDELLARIPQGNAWAWIDDAYTSLETIVAGTGVWLYSGQDFDLAYIGQPPEHDELTLGSGWNLVGPVNDSPRPDGADILSVFGWETERYEADDQLQRGHGYWIYVEE